jgi:tripartite motif-containing protein 71
MYRHMWHALRTWVIKSPMVLLAAVAISATAAGPALASKGVDSKLVELTPGVAGGEFGVAKDLAVDQDTGQVYVADSGNNRIQRLSSEGVFEVAWGRDVVVPGGTGNVLGGNEIQRVSVRPGGAQVGRFSLEVIGPDGASSGVTIQSTATASAVQQALEGTPLLGPGDVLVAGPEGGPWTVEFDGEWADSDVPRMVSQGGIFTVGEGESATLIIVTGPTAGVRTLVNGGGPMEVCTVESQCRRGGVGNAFDGPGGEFREPQGVTLGPNGNLFVTDSGNARVQEFSFDDNGTPADSSDDIPVFERAWGRDVSRAGTSGDIAVDEQQTIMVSGATAGQFTVRFEHLSERRFEWSVPIAHDATAATVLAALEEGVAIQPGDVAVSGPAGGPWIVDFGGGAFSGQDVPSIEATVGVVPEPLSGSDPNVEISSSDGSGFEACESAPDCKSGAYGSHPGQLGYPLGRRLRSAVDPTSGEVYVADSDNRRISRFDPDAATAADIFVQSYGSPGSGPGQFSTNQPEFVAVDPAGILYASDGNGNRVQRLNPDSDFLAPISQQPTGPLLADQKTAALAVDPSSGNLLIWRDPPGTEEAIIQEIDPVTEEEVDRHLVGAGFTANIEALAANGPAGTLYAIASAFGTGDPGAGGLYLIDADGSPPAVSVLLAPSDTDIGARTVTFKGTVNPNGTIYTSYRFEYSSDGETWQSVPGKNVDVGTGTTPIAVEQLATGLEPNTHHLVRLVTSKAYGNGTTATATESFVTDAAPPTITGVAADSIEDTSVGLLGRVDPESSATTYRFEYGTDTEYGSSVPLPDGSVGSGPSKVFVAEQIAGLQPGTTYHYQLVAENSAGTAESGDYTFTTRASPRPSGQRAYELVTPPYKEGGRGVGEYNASFNDPDGPVAPGLASSEGNRYISASFLGGVLVEGKAIFATDYALSERTSSGWKSASPWTRRDYSAIGGFDAFFEPYASSPDLSLIGWHINGQSALLFPEMESWDPKTLPNYLSTWDGRWELLAPKAPDQGLMPEGRQVGMGIAANAARAYFEAEFRGLLGARDASLDQLPGSEGGRTPYGYDVSDGVSDAFPGTGSATLVAACTGKVGSDRTEVPLRLGSGKQGAQDCRAALTSRDARLVSARGASIRRVNPARNTISADGRRIFFTSPDPGAAGVPSVCSGTGLATSCPPQLYVRVEDEQGNFTARWISRTEVVGQDASLMARVVYEGASADGDKVFFRTNAPLTDDDPNGACGTPCLTGTPDPNSWDLYMFDFSDDPADDPGEGDLIRISAGPDEDADPNVSTGGTGAALRFAADDASRVYFVTAAPIPGVPTNAEPGNGTSTVADGTPSTTNSANLYLYDAAEPLADRWQFVALLPKSTEISIAGCATHFWQERQAKKDMDPNSGGVLEANCVRGNSDGSFVTFWADGGLEDDDESPASGDIYGFDAEADRLIRLSAPRDSNVEGYLCRSETSTSPEQRCFADPGFIGDAFNAKDVQVTPLAGVAAEPDDPSARIAFFQSKARLLPGDVNDQYDVYEWRDGDLNLLSTGTSANGAYYGGNGASGKDVFIHTKDRLTWADVDAEMDVYDARVGGGFPEPQFNPCDVLGDQCQGVPSPPPGGADQAAGSAGIDGLGNVREVPPSRRVGAKRCNRIAKRSGAIGRRAARLGRRAKRVGGQNARKLRRRSAQLGKQAKKGKRRADGCKRRARGNR